MDSVFGQIKGLSGLDCFCLRALEKVNSEWAPMATTLNIINLSKVLLATAWVRPQHSLSFDQ